MMAKLVWRLRNFVEELFTQMSACGMMAGVLSVARVYCHTSNGKTSRPPCVTTHTLEESRKHISSA